MHEDIKNYLDWAERIKFAGISYDYFETSLEKDHGRIEQRRCWVTEEIDWLEQKGDWKNFKSVVMVEAVREVIGQEKTLERRYFISSLEADAKSALKAMRGHWGIENELHWCARLGFEKMRVECGKANQRRI